MHANEERSDSRYELTHWEMNAFWATSILAGALLMVVIGFLVPRLLEHVLVLPLGISFALGFMALTLAQYPVMRIDARLAQPPRKLSFRRYAAMMLLGSVVGTLVFLALHAIGGPF
jgi:hypothetical protein